MKQEFVFEIEICEEVTNLWNHQMERSKTKKN